MDSVATITSDVQGVVKDLGVSEEMPVHITIPTDLSHGDYTTNIAFQLSKLLKKSPMTIAQEIVEKLESTHKNQNIAKAEALVPGFINFWLSDKVLFDCVKTMVGNPEKVGRTTKLAGKKISVEFTDPNPFKEFHIGHVYTNTVGESISRLFEANGATVWRADYFGDVGMHIAKSIYGILQKIKAENAKFKTIEDLEKIDLKERIKFIGEAYALGSQVYEEDTTAQESMKKLNRLIFIAAQRMWKEEKGLSPRVDYRQGEAIDEKELQEVYEWYVKGRSWSLDYFDSIYLRLGMHFNGYYPESIAGERGYKLVKEHIADGIFQEDQGAIVFSKEKHGLHTRVFINSLGLPTYEAKELGLAPWKYEEFPYNESYIITGNEITEYFKVLVKALTLINPELGAKTHHIGHGMVRLPEGKMSSRTGKIITGESVLNEAMKKAEKLSNSHNQNDSQTTEQVGIGAVKYAFLKSSIGKDIEFDIEKSLSLNGNSGPYIQYTYVRTQSILTKGREETGKNQKVIFDPSLPLTSEELMLLRMAWQFSEIVSKAGQEVSPSTLCTYLYELSQAFNLFYQKVRIADAASSEERLFRLSLTEAIGIILKQGLFFLGIEAPKRM